MPNTERIHGKRITKRDRKDRWVVPSSIAALALGLIIFGYSVGMYEAALAGLTLGMLVGTVAFYNAMGQSWNSRRARRAQRREQQMS